MTWISYAQNHEDVALMRALGHLPTGFYIDVGAHDPVADSVTKAFYDRGWCGINVEPVAAWFDRLAQQRPRDVNLQVAAGEHAGHLTLHDVEGTGLSTADAQQAQAYRQEGLAVQSREVPVLTLNDIWHRHAQGREVHFLKIDVEGAERAVLQGLDLTRFRPWVILLEATRPRSTESTHQEWEHLLLSRGYQFVWFDGLNRFYVADERQSLRHLLAQPPSVHDNCMRFTERFLRDDVADYAVLLQQSRQAEQIARRELWALRQSRSWRWTAPWRAALAWWRGAPHAASPQPATAQQLPVASTTEPAQPAQPGQAAPAAAAATPHACTPPAVAHPGPTSAQPFAARLRPRLALFAPWPPQASGIADTVAMLWPHLAQHFDIDVVVPSQPESPEVPGPNPVLDESPPMQQADQGHPQGSPQAQPQLRSRAWFERHAHHFDHLVHHLGNSLFHTPTWDLLPRYGGTVVVHDLLIADLLWYLQRTAQRPHAWVQALYGSHGWPALVQARDEGIEPTVRRWPASLQLLQHADGLIFTSEFSRSWWMRLAGAGAAGASGLVPPEPTASVIPLPQARLVEAQQAQARQRLQGLLSRPLQPDEFVVGSFGAVDASKLHHRLIALWPSLAAQLRQQGAQPRLLLAGACADPALQQAALQAGIDLTGHLSAEHFQAALQASDIAVQLRQSSRGESSGALLQAWAAGLPTIINRHGPMAQLPAEVALALPEVPSDQEILQAVCTLHAQPEQAAALRQAAFVHLQRHHEPAHVALLHAQAIEAHQARSPRQRQRHLLQAWRSQACNPADSAFTLEQELQSRSQRVQALAAADPGPALRTLWVDITAIAQHDLHSGIQRVTRNLLRPLLERGVLGWRVEPVYLNHGRYWVARSHTAALLSIPPALREGLPADEPVAARSGDVFFGLDLVTDGVHQHEALLREWAAQGVRLAFMVHDLLPLSHPQWFPPAAVAHFQGWWATLARTANLLVCNSQATAQAVLQALLDSPCHARSGRPPVVQAIGLGANLDPGARPASAAHAAALSAISGLENAVLVVGTIEPRKGVDTVVDAMEQLWAQGHRNPLVLVGRAGWMTQPLQERLRHHPEIGQRLHWLEQADDPTLAHLYGHSRLLVMASHAEGFGLPVVEALRAGLPVLARDLPVFREIAGPHANYWSAPQPGAGSDAQALHAALCEVLQGPPRRHPVSVADWDSALARLVPLLLGPGATCV